MPLLQRAYYGGGQTKVCGAVNPSLPIIANAIRVADHLLADRLT